MIQGITIFCIQMNFDYCVFIMTLYFVVLHVACLFTFVVLLHADHVLSVIYYPISDSWVGP